jgi:2-dehydro-3-deoxyphosphogluconate aldolase/(4S)-4-hydroxy-2-oxoglutarate aldolase
MHETRLFPESLRQRIHQCGVLAVVVIEDPRDAEPLADALLEGGIHSIELTLRTPTALDSLKLIAGRFPEMLIGAGTVLSQDQASAVRDAGAAFAVSPGTNPRVIARAAQIGLPFAPGICTPTDIELAIQEGCAIMKFFPCEACGGLKYLQQIQTPFEHLGAQFIPLGGIHAETMDAYLQQDFVLALGGSWIANKETIRKKDWSIITQNAREAISRVHAVRGISS